MENKPETGVMAIELLDKLIEDGIKSAERSYEEGSYKLSGALEGFELARTLPATYEDFDWIVAQRLEAEKEMKATMRDKQTKEDNVNYWHHRWATLQLEYCRDVLLIAKHASGEPLPPGTQLSARAAMRYNVIVGVGDIRK